MKMAVNLLSRVKSQVMPKLQKIPQKLGSRLSRIS
jgi:hypothetical protein